MSSKILLLIAVALATFNVSQAQIEKQFNYKTNYEWKVNSLKYTPIEYEPAQNVKEITFNVTRKKAKVYKKDFSESGKLTGYYKVDENGTSLPVWKFYYNGDDKLAKVESFKKGQLTEVAVYGFTEQGKPLSQEITDGANKTLYKNVWTYDANGCYKDNILYKKEGLT